MKKFRWLLPHMSFRGRVLVINNLVALMLWHRLACLKLPPGLLEKIQAKLVEFFWDKNTGSRRRFYPYEEKRGGGQGLIKFASRTVTFRIQSVQRFLTGLADLVWRELASCMFIRMSNLGLHAALFLIYFNFIKVSALPPFYKSVVKSWAFLRKAEAGI